MPDTREHLKHGAVWLAEQAGWLTSVDRQLVDRFLSGGFAAHARDGSARGVSQPPRVDHSSFHLVDAQPLLKRILDLVMASAMLVLLLPLMALAAILVKLTSAGPVFVAQKHLGLSCEVILMYKFRTTHMNWKDKGSTPRPSPGNPRRTRLGALLRKTKIDELPLFLNVIKGNMSLVGPRPEELGVLRYYLGSQESSDVPRHVKPGMVELSQVATLVDEVETARTVEANLYYIKNWSLALDVKILWHAPRAWLLSIRSRLARGSSARPH